MDDKDDVNKVAKQRKYRAEVARRYRVRVREQLIQAYGGACSVCGTEEDLVASRQVPLPRGMVIYEAYAKARRLGYPEGLYKLYCKQHHPTWSPTGPVPLDNDPALAAWLDDQNR